MKCLDVNQLKTIAGGSDAGSGSDVGSWMPWNLISDISRELGQDFGEWWNGTYTGSRYE